MSVSKLLLIALTWLFIARLLALLFTWLRHPVSARVGWIASMLADIIAIFTGAITVTQKATLVLPLPGGDAFGLSSLRLDELTGFFLFLTGIVGLPLTIFSSTSFGQGEREDTWGISAVTYHLLLFAVILTIAANTVFVFLFGWELLSLTMYLAIVYRDDRFRAPAQGFFTMALSKVPATALIAAFALLLAAGALPNFPSLTAHSAALSPALRTLIALLALIGFGAKVGLVPMQVWLPRAYPSASGNVAAAMAGIALNVGIYGILRFEFTFLGTPALWIGILLMLWGAVTALVGILSCAVQDDLKRFIAYSSVEQAGIVSISLGVALIGKASGLTLLVGIGLVAACMQLFQHALAKSLLFLGASTIERSLGTSAMARLGGLLRRTPLVSLTMLAGVASLAALPPLGGFSSEWLTFEALMQGFRLSSISGRLTTAVTGALLALTAGLTLIAFVKFYGIVFLGITRSDRAIPLLPMPWQVKLALSFLALCLIVESLSIPWLMQFIAAALTGQVGKNIASTLVIWPHLALQPAFGSFSSVSPPEIAITLVIFSLFPFLLRRLLRAPGYRRSPTPVWSSASGWQERMITYTPLAFSNMMRIVFQLLYQLRRQVRYQHSPLQPGPISYRSQVRAPFEEWLYQPAIRIALRIAALVRRTQSGSLGLYLFYLLLVLLAILTVMPLVLGGI